MSAMVCHIFKYSGVQFLGGMGMSEWEAETIHYPNLARYAGDGFQHCDRVGIGFFPARKATS